MDEQNKYEELLQQDWTTIEPGDPFVMWQEDLTNPDHKWCKILFLDDQPEAGLNKFDRPQWKFKVRDLINNSEAFFGVTSKTLLAMLAGEKRDGGLLNRAFIIDRVGSNSDTTYTCKYLREVTPVPSLE